MSKLRLILGLLLAVALPLAIAQPKPKQLLAVGMSAGFTHDSVSDALATLHRLGKDSGLWNTTIRSDVQLITKKKLRGNAKNLDYFDAVFFMTTGELPLDSEQKEAFLSFVRDDGKGFLGAHNATDTFYEWAEYGEMIGGYFDGHPWNQFKATVVLEDRDFAATRHFPPRFVIHDEIYQFKNFSSDRVRLLMSLDTTQVDMAAKGVKQAEIPIAWTRQYGAGRVFYCSLGHRSEVWENPVIQTMWVEAVKWAMGD